jgi:hypothetical protein
MLKAALRYRALGWSVIPINPRSKKPLIEWDEFQQRLPSQDEIRAWWRRFPKANVGVVTGRVSGLVVVDVETRSRDKIREITGRFPTRVRQRTGRGGVHLFYDYPRGLDRVPCRVDKEAGIDVRADGGYVVAAPSTHPDTGKRYAWLDQNPLATQPELKPAPPAYLRSDRSTRPEGKRENWLAKTLGGVGSGERNDAGARLAGYYFGKSMPFDVVLSLMVDWNEKNQPPLGYREIVTIVQSVWQTHERNGPRDTRSSETHRHTPKAPDATVDDPFALMSLDRYMAVHGSTEISWMVDGWLPDKTIALMVAPPGSYKTWLELALAVSIASGRPFLGQFRVTKPGPVIVVQQEDFHGQVAERLGVITHHMFGMLSQPEQPSPRRFEIQLPPTLPLHLHPDRRLRFDDTVVLDELEKKIERIRPRLVIIDPLYSAGNTDDYMARTVQSMFRLKEIRDRHDCSFLLSHHTKKNTTEGSTDRGDLWGSQFLNAFLETGWQVRRRGRPGQVNVRRHFKVSPDAEEAVLTFDISTKRPYSFRTSLRSTNSKDQEDDAPDIMTWIATNGPVTIQQVAEALNVNRSTASRRIKRLVDAQVLQYADGGRVFAVTNLDSL